MTYNRYQSEIDAFYDNFNEYKSKRIVLYGIGRYTATIVDGIKDFNIVGLMDKDENNVGKTLFGLPIFSKDEVLKTADLIIINTSGTYWNIIYDRIKNLGIPVFYRDGQQAKDKTTVCTDNEYWNESDERLKAKICNADVVSYDFYDTLFSRSVCNPGDVADIIAETVSQFNKGINFGEARKNAKSNLTEDYSIDDLYQEIQRITGLDGVLLNKIKLEEIRLEESLLIPREPVLKSMKIAIDSGKEVYVVSDMYLPYEFFDNALRKYGITLTKNHILISNELKASKREGTIWRILISRGGDNDKILHIGDNQQTDVDIPRKYGIETYYVAGATALLNFSSLGGIGQKICSNYDSAVLGIMFGRMFQSPFCLASTKGRVKVENDHDMGYYVFGPVILTFLKWLQALSEADHVRKLVFMSRDGYFLKQDYEYYCEIIGEKCDTCYVGISRQLAMTATADSGFGLKELLEMPYSGTDAEMLKDRFDIDAPDDARKEDYLPDIKLYTENVRKSYLSYIDKFELCNQDAIVDLGYFGNNQRYLNKLCNTSMSGYYFNANNKESNPNSKVQGMKPCFQSNEDLTGNDSYIHNDGIFLESFLTAPYGMVRAISPKGELICNPSKQNQRYFSDKVSINEGVKQYISDFEEIFSNYRLEEDTMIVDRYYGYCFEGMIDYSSDVKKSFYNDNGFMNRYESSLFA